MIRHCDTAMFIINIMKVYEALIEEKTSITKDEAFEKIIKECEKIYEKAQED